jgi:hypothetical protein
MRRREFIVAFGGAATWPVGKPRAAIGDTGGRISRFKID